jgi:tetratricopeptide (TPR) repeat protein
MMRAASLAWWLAVATLLSVRPISAIAATDSDEDEEVARALKHYTEARALYDSGAIAEAMAAFQAAYAVRPDPAFLFDIGQCQRRLGRREEALASYRAFLRERPNSEKRDVVERLIASLERNPQLLAAPSPPPSPPPSSGTVEKSARPALYRRWWLWTAVGGTALAGLAIGLGVGLTARPTASTTAPAFQF